MAKQDDYVRYTIRVPEPLYRRLQKAAGEASVNAEIVRRLEQTFELDRTAAEFPGMAQLPSATELDEEFKDAVMLAVKNVLHRHGLDLPEPKAKKG